MEEGTINNLIDKLKDIQTILEKEKISNSRTLYDFLKPSAHRYKENIIQLILPELNKHLSVPVIANILTQINSLDSEALFQSCVEGTNYIDLYVLKAMKDHGKLHAVKLLKEFYPDKGLKECKDIVDEMALKEEI